MSEENDNATQLDLDPPLNVKRWLIACDESGIDGQKYYGFGSLWMLWQRRGDFRREFEAILANKGFRNEVKWKKAHSESMYRVSEDLIDFFFRKQWLAFHCVVVKKSLVNKNYHDGDYDLARRKHFTMLLTRKMKYVINAHPNYDHEFRFWVDPIASRYKKADEEAEKISVNILNKEIIGKSFQGKVVITEHDSKSQPAIQLCDFLLGGVMSAFQEKAESERKVSTQKNIAKYLGWDDLASDTFPRERKFNIWHFDDAELLKNGVRHFSKTRKVNLLHPLQDRNLQKK
ncbi:DUF3800 domain-containing protein [Serratia marcescens]|uniref:DUF3800 domain-containing protein n=1 Tax=Serratia marcescens TaxID=615 RepID=UPI0029CD174F|nr:DUF3800 domain-containing protein [Serratia marcescens]